MQCWYCEQRMNRYNKKTHLCNAPIKVNTLKASSVRGVLQNDDANAVKEVSVLFLSLWKKSTYMYLCSKASFLIVRSKGNRSSSSRGCWTPSRKSTCYARDTILRQLEWGPSRASSCHAGDLLLPRQLLWGPSRTGTQRTRRQDASRN